MSQNKNKNKKLMKTDQLGKKWKLMKTDQLGMKWKLMKTDQPIAPSWMFIMLVKQQSLDRVTLSCHSSLLFINAACLQEKQQIPFLQSSI